MSHDIQKNIIPREEFLHKKAEIILSVLSRYQDDDIFYSLSQLFQGLVVHEDGSITCTHTDIPHEHLLCLWMVAHTCPNIKRINLRKKGLSILPPNFSNFVQLEEICISHNRFSSIPSVLFQLPSLRKLSLNGNPLRLDGHEFHNEIHLDIRDVLVDVLPHNISELHLYGHQFESLLPHIEQSKITKLYINDFQKISEYTGTLPKITHFEVHNALIKSLPPLLNQCPNIEHLSWNNGHLVQWPDNLHLPNLQYLSLQNNRIAWLSGNLQRHTRLHTLDLSHNSLRFIPQSVRSCTQLHVLRLASCQLKRLDTPLSNMTDLSILDISGNPLQSITPTLASMNIEQIDIRDTNIQEVQSLSPFIHGYNFEEQILETPLLINSIAIKRSLKVKNLIRFIDDTTLIDELDVSEQVFSSADDFVHILKRSCPKILRLWKTTIPGIIPEDCPRPKQIFAELKDFNTFPTSWQHLLIAPRKYSVHIECRFRESTFRSLLLQMHPDSFTDCYDVPKHISLPHGQEQYYLDLFSEHEILLREVQEVESPSRIRL